MAIAGGGAKCYMREADTTTITTMMATACKEGSLSDLRELLEADVGVAASTLKVPQVAVDQAAGAGHTEVGKTGSSTDRFFSPTSRICVSKQHLLGAPLSPHTLLL